VRASGVAGRKLVAVVILALDGMGLGHLIRGAIVSHALTSIGERPVIFTEAKYRPAGLTKVPVRLVPPLWGAADEIRKRVSSELLSMTGISLPAVLVEDTHPCDIQLPASVRRVLLVRPTSFDYLFRLNERAGALYSAFLLCDSPDSPTWPYDDIQTRQLAGWKKWSIIGPLYRTPSDEDVREVRMRNRISDDQELCIFTMGGGGVHVLDPKGQDIIRFLRLASQVADAVQAANPAARMMFVRGPLFPPRIPIPSRFEIVREDAQMPALLKIAKGAVIRAGFNTTWECLSVGTPFLPMIGTTYVEPVAARMDRMASLGLVPSNIESFWFDDRWRAEYRRIAAGIVAAHSGVPDPARVGRLILNPRRTRTAAARKPRANRTSGSKHRIPLVIRIDDVVCQEPALCWLLDVLASRGMRASLEVVPYLARLDQAFLDRFDPSAALFEVSQHGYAHLPCTSDKGLRGEFSFETASSTAEEYEAIARGKTQLEERFSRRFTGGFSPPYDALPAWLPAVWHSLGGAFVSCLHTNSVPGTPLPVRRAGVDVWDWTKDRALGRDAVTRKLAVQLALDGHTGIVLHPRCLRDQPGKLRLLNLLNCLEAAGAGTVSLWDVALGKVEPVTPLARIGPLWKSFAGKPLEEPHDDDER
jgi:hypothetical protein